MSLVEITIGAGVNTRDILQLLEQTNLPCFKGMGIKEAYKKIRIQLFNERKKIRNNLWGNYVISWAA